MYILISSFIWVYDNEQQPDSSDVTVKARDICGGCCMEYLGASHRDFRVSHAG